MAVANGLVGERDRRDGERAPLLRDAVRIVRGDVDNGSEETLMDERERDVGDAEEGEDDHHKANQQVRRGRGFLIMLSLWGLIFLQGQSTDLFVFFFWWFWERMKMLGKGAWSLKGRADE
jgi:hypothetical protein